MESNTNRRGPAIKAALFIIFLVTAIGIVRFTPLKEHLSVERLGLLLESAGALGTCSICLRLRCGCLPFYAGNTSYQCRRIDFWSIFRIYIRLAGRHDGCNPGIFYRALPWQRFRRFPHWRQAQKYDEAIERNGFATVLYLAWSIFRLPR